MPAAAIRHNNPGAMWPGPSSRRFGAVGEETIGGGNKIATFPNPESGAAAQFDLLSRSYAGMPLSAAINKWSGGNSPGQYMQFISSKTGLSPSTVVTPELLASPQGLGLVKAMARHEAGSEFPLNDEQWANAQKMAFSGGVPIGGGYSPPTQQAQARYPSLGAGQALTQSPAPPNVSAGTGTPWSSMANLGFGMASAAPPVMPPTPFPAMQMAYAPPRSPVDLSRLNALANLKWA